MGQHNVALSNITHTLSHTVIVHTRTNVRLARRLSHHHDLDLRFLRLVRGSERVVNKLCQGAHCHMEVGHAISRHDERTKQASGQRVT